MVKKIVDGAFLLISFRMVMEIGNLYIWKNTTEKAITIFSINHKGQKDHTKFTKNSIPCEYFVFIVVKYRSKKNP